MDKNKLHVNKKDKNLLIFKLWIEFKGIRLAVLNYTNTLKLIEEV